MTAEMTKDDTDEILAMMLTTLWSRRFPDLPRHLVYHNVCCALQLIPRGLMQAQECGVTGEINECMNWYEVRVP